MGIKRPPRLRDFEYRGLYRYFLTICTFQRLQAFADVEAAQRLASQFLQAAEDAGFAVIAYCYMPDHLHALVAAIRPDADLRAFVSRWKQLTGFAWKRRTGRQLWQEGYYDHVVRDDEPDLLMVAYIAANPVDGGLAKTPDDYPLFGSSRYTIEEIMDAIAMDVPWHPSVAQRRRPSRG